MMGLAGQVDSGRLRNAALLCDSDGKSSVIPLRGILSIRFNLAPLLAHLASSAPALCPFLQVKFALFLGDDRMIVPR